MVGTARLALDGSGKTVLALGFGATDDEAIDTAAGSLAAGFDAAFNAYKSGWNAYDATLTNPRVEKLAVSAAQRKQLKDAYYLSANVIKASEDKTFPGAIVASLASPWGQAVSAGDPNNTYFGSYREVFARDLYESWTGLVAAGDLATARDATLFLFERQQLPDGSFPRNSLVNGKVAPDSFGTQLDEVAYPILMAYQLGLTDASLYEDHIKPAANYVAAHGPAFGVERWEEQSGYSPSTIASEIAGLVAAAELATANGDDDSAAVWLGVADEMQRSVKEWTVTTNGPLSDEPYFIRLSKTGDPNAAINYNVGNGGPTLDQREVIDAGFLELVRLGELPADDPDVLRTLPIVDAEIKSTTPSGPGWHRYNGDGYGDRASDGRPWAPSGQGTGHLWPVLSAERAEHALASGDTAEATSLLLGMRATASGVGLIPEQAWELDPIAASPYGTDPTIASIGFQPGKAAGSASPLTWSAASFVRLTADLAAKRNVVLPAATHDRYVAHSQGTTPLTVTAPDDKSSVTASPVTVTGTTTAGNTVYVAATNTDANTATTIASTVAAPDGSFSIDVEVTGGTNVINIVAVSPSGGTAQEQRTILFDFVPGTLILEVDRPRRRRQRPRQLRVPDVGQLPRRRLRHPAVPGLRRRDRRHLQAPDAEPERDLRESARGAARRRVRPRPRGRDDLDRGRQREPELPDRAAGRVEPAHPGPGLRPALRGCLRYDDARHGVHQRQPDLALHHLPGAEGLARPAGQRLELHRGPHRAGRLQPRPGARLPVDAAGLPVRRLRDGQPGCALHRGPGHGSQAHGRDHPARRRPVGRGRLHDPHAGRAFWRGHPVVTFSHL